MLYTAVIVEPRKHKALPYVLENFLNNLSEDWSFIIFHGNLNLEFINNIITKKLSIHKHRIRLINLNVNNLTVEGYNKLFKYCKKFYNYIPTETFLVFQTDSIIFEKHKHLINNFLNYDYVGAPWNHVIDGKDKNECVGNGGLSLRKKSKMLEIMEKQGKNKYPEDIYFSCYDSVLIHKPKLDEASLFSVEEIFSEISFGCHRPWCNFDINKCDYDFIRKKFILYNMYNEVKELYKYNNIPPPVNPSHPKPTLKIMSIMSIKKKIKNKNKQFFINF
jgi:hypothetical protein